MTNKFTLLLATLTFLAFSPMLTAQVLLTEGFEGGTFPPTGWLTINRCNVLSCNGFPWQQGGGACEGSNDAFITASTNQENAWLISSGISMLAGETYEVRFRQSSTGACGVCDGASMRVYVGTVQNYAPAGTSIWNNGDFRSTNCILENPQFVAPSNGTYYLKFYCYSSDFQSAGLSIDDIVVERLGAPLPVELSSFEATVISSKQVVLTWQTMSETNSDRFEIERSFNGIDFHKIGFVEGAGNSTAILNYNFVDKDPMNGQSYYRIKQVDFDASSSYSNLEAVEINRATNIQIIPNPARDIAYINLSSISGSAALRIFNITGQIVKDIQISGQTTNLLPLDISDLEAGTYVLEIRENAKFYHKKFIKSIN